MYVYKAILVDSQEMQRTDDVQYPWGENGHPSRTAWAVKSIEFCCNHMARQGWEHYETVEVRGNEAWTPDNMAQHGFLLMFRRKAGGVTSAGPL